MPEDMAQDVTQVEETTEASSAENQTDETIQEETQDDSGSTSKTVPYERLQEVINSKNELKGEIDRLRAEFAKIQQNKVDSPTDPPNPQEETVKQQLNKYLKELGYVSKEELEQKEADRQLEQTIDSLSGKYNGKDGRPKFEKNKVLEYAQKNLIGNLEIAYKQMHEAELIDFAVKQALGKTKGVKSESSDGSGSTQVGTTQSDLLEAAKDGDSDAISTLIKRTL